MDRATLCQFALVNDAAAATRKKLQKVAALAAYLRDLDEADLILAVRFAAGRAFAATDERVLNVGGALVSEAVLPLLNLDPAAYHDLVVRSGEIGEGLAAAWPAQATAPLEPSPQLRDLARAFDELAGTGRRERKVQILREWFARCATGREAAYLAKIILGDMRTGVQEGVLQAAVARAFACAPAEIQRCQLLVGDLGEVALLARHDRCGAATFRLFHPLQFMLATPQETADDAAATADGRPFYAEDKLDGVRAQVHKAGDGPAARVAIYTRTLDRADASFPDVVTAVAALPGDFLLDGEIVPWRDGRVLPFAHIQKRLGRKALTPKLLKDNPCAFVAFDALYKDGDLLIDRPLRGRRAALDALAGVGPAAPASAADGPAALTTPSGTDGTAAAAPPRLLRTELATVGTAADIAAVFDAARGRRNEGIVLKDPDSPYSPGRRGRAWLKLKTHLPTFDCVVTAAETGHGRRRNSLSDYTFAVWDRDPAADGARLVNVGKAFSGVTDEEIAQLTDVFTQSTTQQFGRVRLVTPAVVLEIACDQIQRSARHASGFALRFPRIKRIRWDKRPADADRLARIVEIYESAPNFARPTDAPDDAPAEPTLFDL